MSISDSFKWELTHEKHLDYVPPWSCFTIHLRLKWRFRKLATRLKFCPIKKTQTNKQNKITINSKKEQTGTELFHIHVALLPRLEKCHYLITSGWDFLEGCVLALLPFPDMLITFIRFTVMTQNNMGSDHPVGQRNILVRQQDKVVHQRT